MSRIPIVSTISSFFSDPITLIVSLLAVVLSIGMHEYAHAFAAHKMGDDTAKNQGLMKLNPFTHIDWRGFLCMLLLGFGWGKPTPVNPNNYRNRKKGEVVVGLAGVATNFVMAFLSILLLVIFSVALPESVIRKYLLTFLLSMGTMNLTLCFFNLLPIPPLDGYGVLKETVLIGRVKLEWLWNYERYGFIVLLILIIIPNAFGLPNIMTLVRYLINWVFNGMMGLSVGIVGVFV